MADTYRATNDDSVSAYGLPGGAGWVCNGEQRTYRQWPSATSRTRSYGVSKSAYPERAAVAADLAGCHIQCSRRSTYSRRLVLVKWSIDGDHAPSTSLSFDTADMVRSKQDPNRPSHGTGVLVTGLQRARASLKLRALDTVRNGFGLRLGSSSIFRVDLRRACF